MISEVLFGYFSRSWIPLIGGIQRAELFKEKVTDAPSLLPEASPQHEQADLHHFPDV
jgi:hypothetical protein